MIVTCERCATQFQLDDARIPPGGVRVRCSRCKHAFEIRLPEPGAPEPPPESATDDEESDWEFNQHVPSEECAAAGTGPEAGAGLVDSLLGDAPATPPDDDAVPGAGATFSPSGLELREDEPAAETETPEPPPAPVPEPAPELERPGTAPPAEPPDLFAGGDAGAALFLETESAASTERDADWDFLTGDDDPAPEPAAHAPDFGAARAQRPAAIEVDPELTDDPPRWQAWLAQGANALGWLVVLALFGFGLHGGLFPAEGAPPPQRDLGRGLEVRDLSGRFVDHLTAGPIYVVSGRLRNTASAPIRIPWLSVELVSAGDSVVAPQAPLGLPRAARELREAPLGALSLGRPLAGVHGTFRPGEERVFEAVLGPVPDAAADFRIVEGTAPRSLSTAGAAPARPAPR